MATSTVVRHLAAAALGLGATVVAAQETVAQPAQSAAERRRGPQEPAAAPTHARSWEAEPIGETRVLDQRLPREEEAIGAYRQPRWTAKRRFPTTRVYVIPEGTAQFEWWWEGKFALGGGGDRIRTQYEFEFGLGQRLQLDLYLTTQQKGLFGPFELHREKVELRYALADWGVIPANPTLYLEFIRQHDGPPKGEIKLLLGGEVAPRWHWGVNLVFERELGGSAQVNEYIVTAAVSYTVRDERFAAGLEVRAKMSDDRGARLAFSHVELLAGPSVQWRPVLALHLDLVLLFGGEIDAGAATGIVQPLLVAGWEF